MNKYLINLSKKIALTLCLVSIPYWGFGMEKKEEDCSELENYGDIYESYNLRVISSSEIVPTLSPQIISKHKHHVNHQFDGCYLKIMAAGELSVFLEAEKGSDLTKKIEAQKMLKTIRELQTYKSYDSKNPKDIGYILKLMDTKSEKLFSLAQSHRDKKDPEYAVDCYSVAAGKLKNYKKAHEEIKKIKNSKNYKYFKECIFLDEKIDFRDFQLEYFFAQRDYLMNLYYSNSDFKKQTEEKQIQVQPQDTIQIQSTSQLVGHLKTKKQVVDSLKTKKQDLERDKASIKKNKKSLEKDLILRRAQLLAEKNELQGKEEKLARLQEDAIQNKTKKLVLEKEKMLLEKDMLKIREELESKSVAIDREYASGGGNETVENMVITTSVPTLNVVDPIQKKEKKIIKETKSSKTLPVLTRRNSTNSVIIPEIKTEEKKEKRGLTRTQSVIELKHPDRLGGGVEEKEKKTKKSINNSKNNANPNRALKLRQEEKKMVRKNSQQNLTLNREWESESELSIAEGDSKNLYVQEGKRDKDLKVIKKLLDDRDLIIPSDIRLTDSKVRRVLRDLAHRNIITWSGQRPQARDEKITATHRQRSEIALTIHLHGEWWLNPAIKEHFMNFVRHCDDEIDSMMTIIEHKKTKK